MSTDRSISETAFEAVADTDAAGGLSESEQRSEPDNFFRHAASLSMTKTSDGLIDPKLVLSWLLTTLGAPAFWIGLLVPVREAGALLPQILTAPHIHAMARRKWAWAAGSAVQGLAAAGIVAAGLTLDGTAAGVTIVLLLGVLALARSVCSVSYKDVLGKTIGKTRRGTVTGLASSFSSVAVLVFALLLISDLSSRYTLAIDAIALAAAFWLVAATIFATLDEAPDDTAAPDRTLRTALDQFTLLRDAPQLRLFITARGLLVGTALAPPFLVILATQAGQSEFSQLGVLVLASSAAAFLSSYVWGRLADRSSRLVLIVSGLFAAASLAAAVMAHLTGMLANVWMPGIILFGLMLAYNGVRQGRSTYLVDMAPEDKRAEYTAVSNTLVGLILLGSGLFGAVAAMFGAVWTIAIFAVMSVAGAGVAYTLDEVQTD